MAARGYLNPTNPAKLTRTLKVVSGGRLMALNYCTFFFSCPFVEGDSVNPGTR